MADPQTFQAFGGMALQGVPCRVPLDLRRPTALEMEKRFLELFEILRKPLMRYLLWIRLGPETAEDIVQETFFRLYEHLTRKNLQEENLHGWVWKVAHNLALKHLQTSKREIPPTNFNVDDAFNALEDPMPNPEELIHFDQKQRRLLDELRDLSVRERQCLHLRAEGLGYREIGEVLGVGRSTVADTLRRAIERMRKAIHD